jgi:hypothetical protein
MPMAELERDVRDHSRILTEHNHELEKILARLNKVENQHTTEEAVSVERRSNLNDRLERNEERTEQIYRLGKWVLGAVGAVFVAVVIALIKGVLSLG